MSPATFIWHNVFSTLLFCFLSCLLFRFTNSFMFVLYAIFTLFPFDISSLASFLWLFFPCSYNLHMFPWFVSVSHPALINVYIGIGYLYCVCCIPQGSIAGFIRQSIWLCNQKFPLPYLFYFQLFPCCIPR